MTQVVGNVINLDISSGFNPSIFPSISNKTAINLFEFNGAMINTAGFERILETVGGNAEGRGIFYSDSVGKCIAVIGSTIYSFTDVSFTILGTLDTVSGKVYFAENGLLNDNLNDGALGQVAISDGTNIYVYSLDGSLAEARMDSDEALTFTPGTIQFQNGFFFINDLDSNRVYASQINNALVWPVLNFTTIGEKTISCLAFKNLLYVFGTDRTYLFYDNAREFFPYTQDVNRSWEFGCFSQSSVSAAVGLMAWLGNDRQGNPTVLASNGGTPRPISTIGIDSIIDRLDDQQDCDAFVYQEDGQFFYQINFNTDDFSLLFNFKNNQWAKITDINQENKNPILQTAYYKQENKLIGLTKDDGKLNEFGINFTNHDGEIVPRTIITQNYTNLERPYIINELDVQMEQGDNQETTKVCLSVSKDRGRTYPINQVKELGPVGERKNLLRFRRMGYARWWTIKLDFFSLDRIVVISAQLMVKE